MLKKTLIGVLSVAFLSALLIAGINFNMTKAVDYSSSGTPVGGIIWENTTWTLENSPYIITDTVQIPEGVMLTIEPGVTVISTGVRDMFLLQGRIEAHGTNSNKIVFDGGGNSNFFYAYGSAETPAYVILSYCKIKNGRSLVPTNGYDRLNLTHSEIIDVREPSSPHAPAFVKYNLFKDWCSFVVGTSGGSDKIYIMNNLFLGRSSFSDEYYTVKGIGYGLVVKYNTFLKNNQVLQVYPDAKSVEIDATENYWGTNDTDAIDSMIYDKKDDIRCAGFIEYLPILTEPHPDTPTLPLTVNFTYSPSVVYAYGAVTFNATASFGPYSSIANYTWDFGDGNITTTLSPAVKHTYTIPDSYNVTLTVTDEFRFQNSIVTSITVLEDDVPPMIGIASRIPEGDVEPSQEVRILVNVTDFESGVKNLTLSCLNIDKPVSNFTTVKDLNVTLCLHRTTYYYKDPVSGDVTITYPNGTAFRGEFILYIRHITEGMSTTAWIAIDGFTKFYLSPPVFQFGPGNYTIGISSLSTADGYIIESSWQVFPSVQVEAKDDSMIWIDLLMTFNSTTGLYEATIPGQPADTLVRYEITAYDNAGNHKVEDNSGQYYVYTVIPEFTSTIILPLFTLTTLIATVLLKKKRKTKLQLP